MKKACCSAYLLDFFFFTQSILFLFCLRYPGILYFNLTKLRFMKPESRFAATEQLTNWSRGFDRLGHRDYSTNKLVEVVSVFFLEGDSRKKLSD